MDVLQTIMAERRADAEAAARGVPVARLRERAASRQHHSLVDSLCAGRGTRIVAEIKKASPSAGLLREDYRPGEIAVQYAAAGAAGISVLTEPRHFLGEEEHLVTVRRAADVPILRKDFVCHPYQIAEAAAWGADVVLLIVAALDRADLEALHAEAREWGLDTLAEAHDEAELETALSLRGAVIGVNSRDLKTLKTDLDTARRLASLIPGDRVSIAESGIRTRAEVVELEALGYNGFLVGEALMREGTPGRKLLELRGEGGVLHGD